MHCRLRGCQPCQTALLRGARRRGSVRAQRVLGRTTAMRREGPLCTLLRRLPTNNRVRRARTASAAAGTPLTSVRCCGGAACHLSPITSTSSGASLALRLNGPRSAWERARDRTPSISVADAYVSRGRAVAGVTAAVNDSRHELRREMVSLGLGSQVPGHLMPPPHAGPPAAQRPGRHAQLRELKP